MARIGFILNAFPVVSETFILNEFRAAEAAGLKLAIFSLVDPPPGPRHETVARLKARVVRAPGRAGEALRAHGRVAMRRPGVYLRTLADGVRDALRGASESRRVRLRRFARRFHRAAWVADAARAHRVKHFHAHYAKEPLEVAALVRRLAGIPYSFTAHAKDLYTASPTRLARRLRRARFAVTCHAAGTEALLALADAEDRDKVLHVAHGIDTSLFNAADRDPAPGRIVAVGRLTPKKGFGHLVAACALLRDRGVPFRCDVFGEGRLDDELRAAIDAADLADRVRLRGFVTQSELRRRYRRAAVVASPAIQLPDGNQDGLQNVVLEAMACGVPVVASRVGGIPEAIEDGRTGVLVEPGDAVALADALEGLLRDPERAARMGSAAALRVEKHDYRQTVTPLIERFRAAVRG